MRKKNKLKRFQVWLDETELDFMYKYAEQNHMTGSELIRGWIHQVMKREGYEIKEPTIPESISRRSK
ncbi:MAG: hypothetical protein GTO02_18075 [Candidatus Dadabacteria bacterium]|nr:hypothetical protein [Candidatus Dadabacteria bacterium]NIQ16222.1 hypothetical protein [Candidatus Dadabacteria bacterium]